MIGARLPLALETLGATGDRVAVVHPPGDADLSALSGAIIVSPMVTIHETFQARGFETCVVLPQTLFDLIVICLPRSRTEARALIAEAVQNAKTVIIDGQKTDGVDSVRKALSQHTNVSDAISKAHGKTYWIDGGVDLSAWTAGPELQPGGFWTAPGVFSADGVDPASAQLISALPEKMTGTVADLGAGWGYLSAHILTREVAAVHLVEAHNMALECARRNVTDDRAQFHWADARTWSAPAPVDHVIMNPPFHSGRASDPELGRQFITQAARLLGAKGTLWLVANRHLAYEETLTTHYKTWSECSGDHRFKVIRADRPKGARR